MRQEQEAWVIDRLHRNVPTCRIDEPLDQVRQRAEQRGLSFCPVINEQGFVLGVVEQDDWNSDPTASAEQLMKSVTTLRPNSPLQSAGETLEKSGRGGVVITNSDGRLLGLFLGDAPTGKMSGKEQLPESEVWS